MRKIALSFFLLLLIFNCSKELETEVFSTEEQQKSKYTLEMLNTSDIPSVSASLQSNLLNNGLALFLEDESAYQSASQTSFQSFGFVPNQPRFWIDKSSVIELRNVNGNITYSFKIVSSEPSESIFYNLIVSKPANGYEPEPFVIRYTHADGITRDDYRKQTNKRFKGRITVYSLEKFASINTFSLSSGLSTLGVKDDVSCADIIADDDSTNNKSSGGSGSSGNGGESYTDDGNYYGNSNSGWSSQGSFGFGGSSGGGKTMRKGSVEVGIGVFGRSLESDTKDDGDLISFSYGSKPLSNDSGCPDVDADIPINDDEKIINELVDKALCVYEKLQELSGGFRNAIQKFDGEFPVSHISFKINNTLPSGNYGITNPPNNFNITIEFSNTQLNNISDLGGAVAFAHEIIHAEIFRKMLSSAQIGNLDPDNMTRQQQINYVNSLRNNFPGIYDYYIDRYRPTWNHNMMAQHYRSTIANIIEQFDNSSKSRQIYEDIAWAGLRIINNPITDGTEISIAWNGLSENERTRIKQNLKLYFKNGVKQCN